MDGLTRTQVAERVARGQVNVASRDHNRSLAQVIRANVFTRFNAIIAPMVLLVLVFGSPRDAVFGLVIVFNSAVGVIQELRAKRTLDQLAVLGRAPVRVRRDAAEHAVTPEEVVLGELILLGAGEKIPVDGHVTASSGLEVDESLLTGESDPVHKEVGAEVMSGSFVVAGEGAFEATKVGPDSYANTLVAEASRFSLVRSELMTGINRILTWVTWLIVPVGVLLIVSQLRADQSLPQAIVSSVAGIVPMIPEGLVLMTTIAFAVGVVRLGRRKCLVQELPAVEGLARVDVLCLDKTGTLTESGMDLDEVRPCDGQTPEHLRGVLAALAAAESTPNPTLVAAAGTTTAPDWPVTDQVPFSSARKWSGVTFDGQGTWVLGAPDVLLAPGDPQRALAEDIGSTGMRVLALGRADALGEELGPVTAAALILLRQRIRPDAAETLRYFRAQDVTVKVISGDNAVSVGAVASSLDVAGAGSPVDARTLPAETGALADVLEEHSVFGRVTPQQKRAFVGALQSRGHTVAMTGDGVNDALALKDADLGVAMGSGSAATRAVAKVVLLDDRFATLPYVVAEGRKVLGNIERVANLFLVKTMYSVALAILVGVVRLPFPFLPRHVTLVGALTIGVPGFFLALAPNSERARPGFVPRVLRFAVPAGLVCALATFLAYWLARANSASGLDADRTTAALTLFLVAVWALALVARPYTWWRAGLVGAMVAAFGLVVAVPYGREFFLLRFDNLENNLTGVGLALVAAFLLTVLLRVDHWLESLNLRTPRR
ncbi:magnesium-transporting ATPase [Longispora fulva]|uniref:Cation-transporting ATPase E n=1 Tax=Longispora fulva TaxID=619741 RepID=A0A8J7GJ51_9ACTN|nr:HAD-IC family P-type ATPase [Longispora fulva]MBG6137468.1 cation-transporting ATPase E [Longispora fulva]GIG61177.1 magnesium-transporting ATPase [Longispora fulva]